MNFLLLLRLPSDLVCEVWGVRGRGVLGPLYRWCYRGSISRGGQEEARPFRTKPAGDTYFSRRGWLYEDM